MKNKKFKKLWQELKRETLSRKSPHEIALGIGAGVFLGVLPVQGFKTAIVALISILYKKINLIALFTVSTIFSLVPVFPFVYFVNYWFGAKILNQPVIFTVSSFRDIDFKALGSAVIALFLGGAVIGTTFGIISYSLALLILKFKNTKNI